MFGCTKPTSEVTAVAQPPLCRYQLGLGIYNVQAAVDGMDGGKKSYLLSLCGQLLRLILIPCHIKGEPYNWTRRTAISYAAELEAHVLGTLCAVTMALLTNRLDLYIQGLFGAGKSKSGNPNSGAPRIGRKQQSQNLIFVQRKLRHTLLRRSASMARPPIGGAWAHRQTGRRSRTE